jgi:hypothetical protein
LGQHHPKPPAGYSQSFVPEMRYFFSKYTKYSIEKLPFSAAKSLAESPCRFAWNCPGIINKEGEQF